jgi:hypothetical protein
MEVEESVTEKSGVVAGVEILVDEPPPQPANRITTVGRNLQKEGFAGPTKYLANRVSRRGKQGEDYAKNAVCQDRK